MFNQNEISKQCDNKKQEEAEVKIEETTINLSCVKEELNGGEFDFDENCYKLSLTFDNTFGESSKEQRDNKDSLIGFLDNEVVMETGTIKLEDVKDEDDLIREIMEQSDCNKCGGNYEGYCPDCSSLSHILNNLTPNINSESILNSVPINMLEIREVSHRKAVFALKMLPKGLILGPFEGVTPIDSTTGFHWKIKDKKLVHDQNANWMQYIESVTNHTLKNLDIFHFDAILFFETTRDIQQGEELLVYYCEQIDDVLKSDDEKETYLVPAKKEKHPKIFACTLCCLGFRLETCLMEHKNKCFRGIRGGGSEDFEITQCRCCKVWLAKQEHLESHMLYCMENYNRACRSFSHLQPPEEISTPIDGSARNLTESEIIQSKRSCGIRGEIHAKERPSTKEKNRNSSIKRFHCDFCKKKYNRKHHLKTHIKNKHSSAMEKEYKCSECSYQTNCKGNMDKHSVTHTGIKRFQCEICKKKFGQKQHLKMHINIRHSSTEEREYKCTECSYETNVKGSLKRHIVIHSDVKPFECHICDRKFNHKAY